MCLALCRHSIHSACLLTGIQSLVTGEGWVLRVCYSSVILILSQFWGHLLWEALYTGGANPELLQPLVLLLAKISYRL